MERKSARKQTLEQLCERRKQVVWLYTKGIKIMRSVSATGTSYPAMRGAIDLFEAGDFSAIRPVQRGASEELSECLVKSTIQK